jgi:hypothetical protein
MSRVPPAKNIDTASDALEERRNTEFICHPPTKTFYDEARDNSPNASGNSSSDGYYAKTKATLMDKVSLVRESFNVCTGPR